LKVFIPYKYIYPINRGKTYKVETFLIIEFIFSAHLSGGGILTEEICKLEYTTTGIEPAEESLRTARNNAKAEGLYITYKKARGSSFPTLINHLTVCFV
jgi:hypothetical protein